MGPGTADFRTGDGGGGISAATERNRVDAEDAPLGLRDLHLGRGEVLPLGLVAAREALPVDVGEEACDGAAPPALRVDAEHALGGGVCVAEAGPGGDHEHALLDGLEDRLQEAALAGDVDELRLEALGVETLEAPHQLVEESSLPGHGADRGYLLPAQMPLPTMKR